MGVRDGNVLALWPFASLDKGGTRAEVHVHEGSASVVLGIDLQGTSAGERRSLLESAVEVRIVVVSGALLVFLVRTVRFVHDMPFCPWINGEAWCEELLTALATLDRFNVAFVDRGLIRRNHRMRTNDRTGPSMVAALRSCTSRLGAKEYDAAVDAYQSRFEPRRLLAMSRALDRVDDGSM